MHLVIICCLCCSGVSGSITGCIPHHVSAWDGQSTRQQRRRQRNENLVLWVVIRCGLGIVCIQRWCALSSLLWSQCRWDCIQGANRLYHSKTLVIKYKLAMVMLVAILSCKRSVIWMLYCLIHCASYVDPYYSLLYQLLRISNFWNIIEEH